MAEVRTIVRHAATVLTGQLAVLASGITDTVVAGRHSEAALAALSVGSAVYVSVYAAAMGLAQALLPVWAGLHGAQAHAAFGRSVRQSLYLCAAAAALGMVVLLAPGPLLRWTQVPDSLQGVVREYLAVLAVALLPALLFRTFATLNQALGRPQLVTALQLAALAAKVPLSIWWTFGGAGVPALGAVGCAWATLAVNVSVLAVALVLLRTQAHYRPYALWRLPEPPDWSALARFARLGVPAALALLVEVTSFTLMALFIARQGTLAAAAHQIAANSAAALYMVPLSLSIATSARVGYWLGAGSPERARRVVLEGFWLVASAGVALAATLFIAREAIAGWYTSSAAVAAAAAGLLAWVAAYHLADAVQTLCVFLLRCWGVTVAPLVIYSLLLWGVGLGGGYLIAYGGPGWPWAPAASPAAFWAAGAAALAVTALAFSGLTWRVLRRRG